MRVCRMIDGGQRTKTLTASFDVSLSRLIGSRECPHGGLWFIENTDCATAPQDRGKPCRASFGSEAQYDFDAKEARG